MITRRKTKIKETKFKRTFEIEVNGFIINSGDIVKINGEHGGKFRFNSLVTNSETGVQWIDCFEMHKVTAGAQRSFRLDRVKRIPAKRGRRRKNVSTT
jgi:hypothetical protein